MTREGDLADVPPGRAGASGLATVAWIYGMDRYALARSVLDAADIPVVAVGAGIAGLSWHHMHAFGGITIRVPEHHETEARALLAPLCTPVQKRFSTSRAVLGVLVLLWAGLPPPPTGGFLAGRPAVSAAPARRD